METAIKKRRRLALVALLACAAGSFAVGMVVAGGGSSSKPSPVSGLSPAELVGQRLIVGFDGTTPPPKVERLIRRDLVAGVILFEDNLPDRDGAREMIGRLQALQRPSGLRLPLLVLVDQEGGLVKRLDGPPTASAAVIGSRGPGFAAEQGERTAASLRQLGINVDLAPVLDLSRPESDTAATERGFGSTPAAVSRVAIPFAAELESGGVAATAKHFPGLGSADLNTDVAVQRISSSAKTLRSEDEVPFAEFIGAGGDIVMISSAIYPALSTRPAAFSRAIATDELRRRLGFDGVSVTDALDSVAVRNFGGPGRAALAAAVAGTDLLLFTEPAAAEDAGRELAAAVRRGRLHRGEAEASALRVLKLRRELVR